jgi:Rhomboid family
VSAGGQDLFVVCKNCGSEVSPYITECPYCGTRLRKRAPKLDRDQRPAERRSRRPPSPLLSRLRRDEIPGIRGERHAYATAALVGLGFAGALIWRTTLVSSANLVIVGRDWSHWWRIASAAFIYNNTGYAFITLAAVALYGWLLERRHGPVVVVAVFALGAFGGLAATMAAYSFPITTGGTGGALALIVAWAIPDLRSLRAGHEIEGDVIGTAAIATAVALMPLAVDYGSSWVAVGVGLLAGLLSGSLLARSVPA